jgi:fused signal recognition particle receptor
VWPVSDKPTKRGGFFSAFRRAAPEGELPLQEAAAAVAATQIDQSIVEVAASETPEPPKRQGWFQRLKAGLTKTSAKLSQDIAGIFTKRKLDADTLEELEDLLIQADLGVDTSMRITTALAKSRHSKEISADEVRAVLAAEVERVLEPVAKPLRIEGDHRPHVILVVGVNGTGKTTTIGKLAHKLRQDGHSVMLAAGDTFRAAAIDQLKIWGERTGAEVIARGVGSDSASLAFEALTHAREKKSDVLLIDTAGRLQNKQVLMEELEKVIRVIRKIDASAPHQVLLVLDATTGQNALNQVEVFKDKAGVTGLVMTKLDGTARGGILVAISAKFGLPVHAIGVGEGVEDLSAFEAGEFARAIALG